MKISVLTPAWNAAATIRWTIDSVLSQDHGDIEHLVLDGASTDATREIVARYDDPRLTFVSAPDRGMYDALNTGLSCYRGEAFGVLNADDTFHDGTSLSRIAEALARADIVHGDLDFVDGHATKRVVRRWRLPEAASGGFRSGWMPAHPTFYVRRAVAERVGAFDLALKVAADYDYMLRAIELYGFTVAKAQGVLVDMMQGGASTSSLAAHVRHNLEALASRRRWLGSGRIDRALLLKPSRKVGQFLARLS